MKQLVTRFVTDMEDTLEKGGYKSSDTEIGKIYYHPDKIRFGESPEVRMKNFLWSPYVSFKDIYAV